LRNSGTINVGSFTAGNTTWTVPLVNSGTISVTGPTGAGATLLFSGSGPFTQANGAVLTNSANGTLDFGTTSQNFTGTVTATGSHLRMSTGTISGAGDFILLGSFTLSGTVGGTGLLNIGTTGLLSVSGGTGTLSRHTLNSGTIAAASELQ